MAGSTTQTQNIALLGNSSATATVPDLLFCIPDNPKLLELWDRVDDRLFKIRHCMNIDGKVRELALFSPPIDPALLVQATAAGLSIEDALSEIAAPLPHYRYSYMLQKANEFTNEVKALGSQLLGLIEKKDGEELSVFRQVHEGNVLKMARNLKVMAIEEAKQSLATLESSKIGIKIRFDDYNNRRPLSLKEAEALNQTRLSDEKLRQEQVARLVAGYLALIPDLTLGTSGVTGTPYITATLGGSLLSEVANLVASHKGLEGAKHRNSATLASTLAGYDRRQEDWELQKKSAIEELNQVERQILGAQIRIHVTEKELQNHDMQIAQSEEMYEWVKSKYTNAQLYAWMINQVKTVHKQMYNLAYSLAKRAQTCLEYELGYSAVNIIQFGHWEASRMGLMAGERLALQLKQLDNKYIENNKREYELSKTISLALLDPTALYKLKASGKCDIVLPEVIFNLDHLGHYFRRIKSVAISIPCIAGPNTNINACLTLKKAMRRESSNTGSYSLLDLSNAPAILAESIATSGAQNDSGMFELNFKDERYVPFEGKGAVSVWSLELTNNNTFDFSTISDVIMHMKYTAREGGESLTTAAKGEMKVGLNDLKQTIIGGHGLQYVASLRHDLPNQWYAFKNGNVANFKVEKSRLPYFMQGLDIDIKQISCVVRVNQTIGVGTSKNLKINGSSEAVGTKIDTGNENYYSGTVLTGLTDSLTTPYTIQENGGYFPNIEDIAIIAGLEIQ